MVDRLNGTGVYISWPMIAVMATVFLSIIVGSLRLGGVQNSVELNTGRLDRLEVGDHRQIEQVSRLKAQQESDERRLDVIESTRPTTGELSGATRSTDARLEGLEYRIRGLEAAPRAAPVK